MLLDPAAVGDAFVTHRVRWAGTAAGLDDAALSTPSRCSEWTVADVLRHGCDVDIVLQAIWRGDPPVWENFDPRTTPHESVLAQRSIPDSEVRDRFVASTNGMIDVVRGYGRDRWSEPSFSPAGPVPWWMSMLHGFFDSWLHQRDALVPLGVEVDTAPDDVEIVLTYSLGLTALAWFFESAEPLSASVAGSWVTLETAPTITVGHGDAPDEAAVVTGDPTEIADALMGRGVLAEWAVGDASAIHALGALARFNDPASLPPAPAT